MFRTNKANPEYLYAAILRPIRTVKTNMAYSTSCFLSLIVMAALTYTCHCADPDALQDFCVADLNSTNSVNGFPCKPVSQVSSSDFFFNGLSKEGDTSNIFGSSVTSANVLSFPGLNTQGLSMNRVDFAPGGVNAPHVHPRSSETGIVIKGTLLVGFITTNNVFYSKVMKAGEMFVIPRGLVHFQQNVGSGKAQTFTAFNSQLPGASVIPLALFGAAPPIPNSVLTKTFQVDEKVVTKIKSEFGS